MPAHENSNPPSYIDTTKDIFCKDLSEKEADYVQCRREKAWVQDAEPTAVDPNDPAKSQHSWDLVGVAISGGGIRSATLGLGVLQGLASMGILRCVDYLSTVSGGGYIGAWLAAWIQRSGMDQVVKELSPDRTKHVNREDGRKEQEPPEIFHLRQFSNYLTPRKSLFSSDTWTLIAIYLRNLLANQLCLLPALLGVVLLVRLIALGFAQPACHYSRWFALIPLICISTAFVLVNVSLVAIFPGQQKKVVHHKKLCYWILLLLVIAAPMVIWYTMPTPEESHASRLGFWDIHIAKGVIWRDLWMFVGLFSIVHLIPVLYRVSTFPRGNDVCKRDLHYLSAALISGASGGALLYVVLQKWLWIHATDVALVATLGPSLLLAIVGITANLEVVLIGRSASEAEREWWARMSGWCLILSLGWAVVFGVSLFGGLWIYLFKDWTATLTLGWVASAVAGVVAGNSPKSNGTERVTWRDLVAGGAPYLFLLGMMCGLSLVAHEVLDVGARPHTQASVDVKVPEKPVRIILEADAQSKVLWKFDSMKTPEEDVGVSYRLSIRNTRWTEAALYFLVCVALAVLADRLVDINEFSLNAMYANRLTRCYLGASRVRKDKSGKMDRTPNELTGVDAGDDLALSRLQIGPDTTGNKKNEYWGPLPIINTALNLVSGDQLAWQERLAESFIVTPMGFGCQSLGFQWNAFGPQAPQHPGMLGRAVAVSGAAANPNMGYHSSPAATALLTLFNIRLGWWMPNPDPDPKSNPNWGADSGAKRSLENTVDVTERPTSLLRWLIVELLGFTNAHRRFVNLSDGGHFENLGAYELIRRRCRLIIVSDGEADPQMTFDAMGTLIRKCRADFGIDIEIDVEPLRPDPLTRLSRQQCVVGTVRYDKVFEGAPVGTLLYIKATRTGDESTDIKQYIASHPEFPHEPTADQFFSESQFESYRQLGLHCVEKSLSSVVANLGGCFTQGSKDKHPGKTEGQVARTAQNDAVSNLVYRIRREWFPANPISNGDFLAAIDPFVRLHEFLRDRASSVSAQIYPELGNADASVQNAISLAEIQQVQQDIQNDQNVAIQKLQNWHTRLSTAPGTSREEFHLIVQMIQVLENAWLVADLTHQHGHPLNVGWMNLFRRWSQVAALRKYWPILRHEFSREFVKFCENWVSFSHGERTLVDLKTQCLPRSVGEKIVEEWKAEWAGVDVGCPVQDWLKPTEDGYGPAESCRLHCLQVKSGDLMFDAGLIGWKPSQLDGYSEFMIWVRPQFREHGIGECMIDKVPWPESTNLFLRYPKSFWVGKGRDIAKSRWLSYFDFYGFRHPTDQASWQELSEGGKLEILIFNPG